MTRLANDIRDRIDRAVGRALVRIEEAAREELGEVIRQENKNISELIQKYGDVGTSETLFEQAKEMISTKADLMRKQREGTDSGSLSLLRRTASTLDPHRNQADNSVPVWTQRDPVFNKDSLNELFARGLIDARTVAISALANTTELQEGLTIDRSVIESSEELCAQGKHTEASLLITETVAAKKGLTPRAMGKIWEHNFDDLCNWARALAKQWTAPPLEHLVSASNIEAFTMAAIHYIAARGERITGAAEDVFLIWQGVHEAVPEFERISHRVTDFLSYANPVGTERFQDFAWEWRKSSYARLEISHKLAAALCLTDVEDVEIAAPWDACSIVVPDGLLVDSSIGTISRIWCIGTEVLFYVNNKGTILERLSSDSVEGRRIHDVVECLVRGAFLALEDPDEFKKQTTKTSSLSSKKQRSGPPDLSQARYMLSAPVKIDLRAELAEHLSGKRKGGGGAPKVQFLVRGHWRMQAHGPGRALRQKKWIKPFWKGDENARVLLRNYVVKDDQNDPKESEGR